MVWRLLVGKRPTLWIGFFPASPVFLLLSPTLIFLPPIFPSLISSYLYWYISIWIWKSKIGIENIAIINNIILNYLMVFGVMQLYLYYISWNFQGQWCKMIKEKISSATDYVINSKQLYDSCTYLLLQFRMSNSNQSFTSPPVFSPT